MMNHVKNFKANLESKCSVIALDVCRKLREKKGMSDLVVQVLLILSACVLVVIVFWPQVKTLLEEIFSGASSKVNEIINLS